MDLIERLRVKNELLLKQLIETHLSFIIETDFDLNLIQNNKNIKRKIGNNSSIFGANLTQEGICSVHQLIEFITSDSNITKEGIFRKSGNSLRQMELKELISSGTTVDLSANRFTVDDCCCVLKKFIGELPEPLLTESHFEVFQRISKLSPEVLSPNRSYPKKLSAIRLLLLLIPAPNRQLLHELLNLFEKVIQNSNSNKMNSLSLATIFSPHLFCPKSFTAIEFQQNLNSFTSTLIYMIDNSHLICQPPPQLVRDVEKQLQIIELKKVSAASLAPVNSSHQFCVRENVTKDEDYTAKELAKLYAIMQSMPQSGTPMKKKWIKRFNRENGKGTPLLKQKKLDSTKKLSSSLGDVFRAGQQLLFGTSDETSKQNKVNKTLFKDSPLECEVNGKQIYKKLTPIKSQINDQNVGNGELNQQNSESVTPISLSLENANKKVRLSVRKIGNREPIVM